MSQNIILQSNPKIEFQLLDNGFELLDEQTERNSGFYSYSDVESVELSKTYFPKLAKFLRVFTWILNGVPYFPKAEDCKKAKVIIHLKKMKIGMWLTDSKMVDKAREFRRLTERKAKKKIT